MIHSRALHMLGKSSTSQLHSQLYFFSFLTIKENIWFEVHSSRGLESVAIMIESMAADK